MTAPIVLFVYNRVDHVKKTLSALAENDLASDSTIYIFSDGPKSDKDTSSVSEVREYVSQEIWEMKFKSVILCFSDKNKGLASSIIAGVNKVISKHGVAIVIEDDCVSSKDFLTFMNDCLVHYQNNSKIWSIGGYSMNLNFPEDYMDDVYFMGRTCSYAWATWKDRWEKVDWSVESYKRFKYNLIKRYLFNLYGNDRAKMLDEQQLGKKNSWAIRFCYAMFENDMLTVYPRISRIKNIGYDIGTHTNAKTMRKSNRFKVDLLSITKKPALSDNVCVNNEIRKEFASAFRRPIHRLFVAYIVNVIFRLKGR